MQEEHWGPAPEFCLSHKTGSEMATTLQLSLTDGTGVTHVRGEKALNYSSSEAKSGSKEGKSQSHRSVGAEHLQGKLRPKEAKGLA